MDKFRATDAKGHPLTGEADKCLKRGTIKVFSLMTGRKGNRKSLLSYKGRINRQPAVEKVTLYSFEPAGIRIWVFQILKH